MKRGDTIDWVLVCSDPSSPNPVDLSTAQTVRFLAARDGATFITETLTIANGTSSDKLEIDQTDKAKVRYHPDPTDADGVVTVEVEATWPNGKIQTFPAEGYVYLRFEPDLG